MYLIEIVFWIISSLVKYAFAGHAQHTTIIRRAQSNKHLGIIDVCDMFKIGDDS